MLLHKDQPLCHEAAVECLESLTSPHSREHRTAPDRVHRAIFAHERNRGENKGTPRSPSGCKSPLGAPWGPSKLLWLGWLACRAQPWLGLVWACLACLAFGAFVAEPLGSQFRHEGVILGVQKKGSEKRYQTNPNPCGLQGCPAECAGLPGRI